MAPEGRVLHIHGLESLWPASQFSEFTESFANSVVNRHRPFTCCVRRHPFTRGIRATKKRKHVSFARKKGQRHRAGSLLSASSRGSKSPSRPCIIFQRAGDRSNGSRGFVRLIPCRYLRPDVLLFRRPHGASWSWHFRCFVTRPSPVPSGQPESQPHSQQFPAPSQTQTP